MSTLAELPILSRLVRALASAATPQEIMAIHTSEEEEVRLAELREKMHTTGLSADEQQEVQLYLYAEHIVKMAKIGAHQRMRA